MDILDSNVVSLVGLRRAAEAALAKDSRMLQLYNCTTATVMFELDPQTHDVAVFCDIAAAMPQHELVVQGFITAAAISTLQAAKPANLLINDYPRAGGVR